MPKKPLVPYHPDALRNRLPSPTVVMPYKNSSQIVIGDRSCRDGRQFVTSSGNFFNNCAAQITDNQGIISEITKR